MESNSMDSDEEIFFGVPSKKEWQISSAMKGYPLNIAECGSASSGLIPPSPTPCGTSINVDLGKPWASSQAGTAYSASGTFTDTSELVENSDTSDIDQISEGMSLLCKDSLISDTSRICDDTDAIAQKQHEKDLQMPSSVSHSVHDMSLSDSSLTESSQRKNIRNSYLSTIDEYDEIDVCNEQDKVMTNLDGVQFASKEEQQSSGPVKLGEDEHLILKKLLQSWKLDDMKKQTLKSQSADKSKENVPSLNLDPVLNELVKQNPFVSKERQESASECQNIHESGTTIQHETVLNKKSFVASYSRETIAVNRQPVYTEKQNLMDCEDEVEGSPSKYPVSCQAISPSVPDKKVSHSVTQRFRKILAQKPVFYSPQLRKNIAVNRQLEYPQKQNLMDCEDEVEGSPSKYPVSGPAISPSVPDKKVSHSATQRFRRVLAQKPVFYSPQLRKPHVPAHRSKIPKRVTTPNKSRWDVESPVAKYIGDHPPPPLVKIIKCKENSRAVADRVFRELIGSSEKKVNFANKDLDYPSLPPAKYCASKASSSHSSQSPLNSQIRKARGISARSPFVTRHIGPSKVVPGLYLHNEESMLEVPEGKKSSPEAKNPPPSCKCCFLWWDDYECAFKMIRNVKETGACEDMEQSVLEFAPITRTDTIMRKHK